MYARKVLVVHLASSNAQIVKTYCFANALNRPAKVLGTMIKPACDQKTFPILLDSESEGSDDDILFERQVVL